MKSSPQQELYTACLLRLRQAFPGMVFDGDLPPENTPYPFIFLAETQQISDQRVKGAIFGRVSISVHVWHNNDRKRGDLSTILFQIQHCLRSISQTDSYGWCLSSADEQIVPDPSTPDPLMHGILELEYKHFWR